MEKDQSSKAFALIESLKTAKPENYQAILDEIAKLETPPSENDGFGKFIDYLDSIYLGPLLKR